MYNKLNTHQLNKEMHYHPSWNNDKKILLKLLRQISFTDRDILKFGRLYTKYNHIHSCKKNELNRYFHFMLRKMEISNENTLFKITNTIYKNKNMHII